MPAHPDPTFHASAKLAMQAPPEKVAYTVMLSPDFSQPDGLAVVDVDPGSKSFGKIVHTVIMPNKGDEFHHFGWNACSSALSPLAGHAFLERRYLIIPGIRSSRIYVVDTKPDPTEAKIRRKSSPRPAIRGLTPSIAARQESMFRRLGAEEPTAQTALPASSSWTAKRSR
jgi:selenium-binding protein 1